MHQLNEINRPENQAPALTGKRSPLICLTPLDLIPEDFKLDVFEAYQYVSILHGIESNETMVQAITQAMYNGGWTRDQLRNAAFEMAEAIAITKARNFNNSITYANWLEYRKIGNKRKTLYTEEEARGMAGKDFDRDFDVIPPDFVHQSPKYKLKQ